MRISKMNYFSWHEFMIRLKACDCTHNFMSPISEYILLHKINEFYSQNSSLREMYNLFNGAELFLTSGPFITLFPFCNSGEHDPLTWAQEWYNETYSKKWRTTPPSLENDYVIGTTNYDGLIVFNDDHISEWDVSQNAWLYRNLTLFDWSQRVISDGILNVLEHYE